MGSPYYMNYDCKLSVQIMNISILQMFKFHKVQGFRGHFHGIRQKIGVVIKYYKLVLNTPSSQRK